MATAVEVEKQMEGLTFASDEDRKTFERILTGNKETFDRRYLRREEGTKLEQQRAAAEAAAAAARAEVEAEKRLSETHMQAMNEWQTTREAELKAEADAKVGAFKTELKAKGIDPDSLLGQQMINTNPNLNPPPPAYGREQMSKDFIDRSTAQVLATTAIDLPMEMARLQAERRELFGDAPVDWAAVGDKAKANIISGRFQNVREAVNATAEEIWKVSEVRETKKTEALRAQIESEVKSKYEEQLAKLNLPGMNAPAYVDPNDKVFTKEFSDKTGINNSDDPHKEEARAHFLQTNAELEAAGISMMK